MPILVGLVCLMLLVSVYQLGYINGCAKGWKEARDVLRPQVDHWYEEAVGWRKFMQARAPAPSDGSKPR